MRLAEALAQEKKQLPNLRVALSRGSKLSPEIQSALEKANPGINVVEGGGLTESSTYVTNPVLAKKVGTVGLTNPGVEIKIVDPKTLQELPRGEIGEILIRAPQKMEGYWKDPKASEEVLLPDGWMRSGDLARMDDEGYVTIVGRLKEIIITGGLNVTPGEIEEILEKHPKIREVAVAGISDPNWFGTSDPRGSDLVRHFGEVVVAFVALKENATATPEEVIAWAKPQLADYKVPKRIVFVDQIPRIGSYDKPDRLSLIQATSAKDGGDHGVFVGRHPRDHFLTVTIDRPGVFPTNALSLETLKRLEEVIDEANQDDEIYSMILTGGGGHFLGGGDLQYVVHHLDSEEDLKTYLQLAERVALKIATGKPVIAVIPGPAVGAGGQLALAARYRIGSPGSYFRAPEVSRLDIIPGFGGTQFIPRVLGIRKTLIFMLTGEKVIEGVFDEVVHDPIERAQELAKAFEPGVIHKQHPDYPIIERLSEKFSDSLSEEQLDEWESVFNGKIFRETPRNRPLLEIFERLKREGHEKAAFSVIEAVRRGFQEPLERGLEVELELAINQMKMGEAKRSLVKQLKEAEKPWLSLYPPGIPEHLDYPDVPIHQLIEKVIQEHPEQKIHFLSGRKGDPEGRTIRYQDLEEPVNRFARALYDLGIRKGDRVAVMLPNSFQYIVALLATSKIGAILAGINTFSTADELRNALTLTEPKIMIMLDEFYPRFTEIRPKTPEVRTVVLTGRDDFISPPQELPEDTEETKHFLTLLKGDFPEISEPITVHPEDVAVLAFTGGVTGESKATELTHRNLIAVARQRAEWLFHGADPTQETLLADLPFYHTYGLNAGLLTPLSEGVHMVVLPHVPKEHADAMTEAISHYEVNYLIGLPTTFDRVVVHLGREPGFLHLKGGLSSGARLEEETRKAFEELTGAPLRQGLGMTEASSILHEPMGGDFVEDSVGVPMPDMEVMVVDPEAKDRLVPVHSGEPGELVVRGPQVFKGYWNNPEETRRMKTEEGWLRTGDLVRMDRAGRIFLLAREKNMIKVSGNQVFPNVIERVLARHPKVLEVAVVGVPDKGTGEHVVAFIVPKKERSLTESEVKDFAAKHLSRFEVPSTFRFLSDSLPRVSFDEVDYKELRRRAYRRHLVESIQNGEWAWALKELQENILSKGKEKEITQFAFETLREEYDINEDEKRRLPIRLFLWALVQKPDLVEPRLKSAIEEQLAYWLFRDRENLFFREPIPALATQLQALQSEREDPGLFQSAWQAIRQTYGSLTPPDIFRISRELTRPKAGDIAHSFLFRDLIELNDRPNPYDITKNERYIPSLQEIQQVSFEWGLSPQEAIEYLRARHDAHYDDPSVFAAIATFVDPYHPEKQTPVMIVGLQKGSTLKEMIARNRGYTMPWGYWKYVRAIRLAERLRLPVISLVDVTGAWNGLSGFVEDTSGAVSYAIQAGAEKTIPGTVIVTGEGGSAGGLAATMDKTFMLSNATRFVATPEGQFEILNLNRKLVSLVFEEVKSELAELFSLDSEGLQALLKETQTALEEVEKNASWTIDSELLIKTLFEKSSKVGGTLSRDEARINSLKEHVKSTWKKYRDKILDQIIIATQSDAKSSLALGAIGGMIEEPIGGAHRFPEGTYLTIAREVSAFLDYIQSLSTEEVLRERYLHFREMGSVAGRDYVVQEHSLERTKASGRHLERGWFGIQDWLERLVDRGREDELLIREIDPDLADLEDGPIDFYQKLDLPDVFPADTYRRNLTRARKETGSWSGLFTGYAKIADREVMLVIKDPRFMGASDKSGLVGEKITLAIEEAITRHDKEGVQIPIVFINTASGARQGDGPRSVDPLNKNNAALSLAKDCGIPFINIDTAHIYGGDSASTSSYQDATMLLATKFPVKTKDGREGVKVTEKGFTGPRPTASVERRSLPRDYFSAEFLVKRGFLDGVVGVEELRDLLVAYLDPDTRMLSAQSIKPLLNQFLRNRQRRVARVREREREGFAVLRDRATWLNSRYHFLGRMRDQQARHEKKTWVAEHVDTETRIHVPVGQYVGEKITFPADHEVNQPPFLVKAHAALAAEFLTQRNTPKAKFHLAETLRLGTGEEGVFSRLESAYTTFRKTGGEADSLVENRIQEIRQREEGRLKASESRQARDGAEREAAIAEGEGISWTLRRGGDFVTILPRIRVKLKEISKGDKQPVKIVFEAPTQVTLSWLSIYKRRLKNGLWVVPPAGKGASYSMREFFPDSVLVVNDGEYYFYLSNFSLGDSLRTQTVKVTLVRGTRRGPVPNSVPVPTTARDGAVRNTQGEASNLYVKRVGDLAFVQLAVDGFETLSTKQKILAYHLTQAAKAGWDIYFQQLHRFGLDIRNLLEEILTHSTGIDATVLEKIHRYTLRVWVMRGIYDTTTNRKFLPEFTAEELAQAVRKTKQNGAFQSLADEAAVDDLLKSLHKTMFDPSFEPLKKNVSPGVDKVVESAVNFYEGVTEKEVESFRARYPLNSRLVKKDGELVEEIHRAGDPENNVPSGLFAKEYSRMIEHLRTAIPYAEPPQAESLKRLIRYFQTGEAEDFEGYNEAWLNDEAVVDIVLGPVEVYDDPFGQKASFQGIVDFLDPRMAEMTTFLQNIGPYLEASAPWAEIYKKRTFTLPTIRFVQNTIRTGSLGGIFHLSGENLPNDPRMKEKYGSKSTIIQNIRPSLDTVDKDKIIEEFSWDPDRDKNLARLWGNIADDLMIGFHEGAGHAIGRVNPETPGQPSDHLKQYYSPLEEARAELAALWFIADPAMRTKRLVPDPAVAEWAYRFFMMGHGLRALWFVPKDSAQWKGAHDIAQNLIINYLLGFDEAALEKLNADGVQGLRRTSGAVEARERDGEVFLEVVDLQKSRVAVGELLAEVMRIIGEGDFKAGQALIEKYGIPVNTVWRDQIHTRIKALDLPLYKVEIQPELVPIYNDAGEIVDVKVTQPRNYEEQMLRYAGRDPSTLPDFIKAQPSRSEAQDGAERQWDSQIADEFALKWAIQPKGAEEPVVVEPTPLLLTTETVEDLKAQREVAISLVTLFKAHEGTQILAAGSALDVARLATSGTPLAIDSTLLEHDVTRKEFEIVLSLLRENGRQTVIWLVDTEPGGGGAYREELGRFRGQYPFVKLFSLGEYRHQMNRLEREELPVIRVGLFRNGELMDLLDIAVRDPREGEVVSAFSFMSLALGMDPAYEVLTRQVVDLLDAIESVLVIQPTEEYIRAVETIYHYL